MKSKLIIYLILCIFATEYASAQSKRISQNGKADVSEFPKIKMKINHAAPTDLLAKDIKLSEGGNSITFELQPDKNTSLKKDEAKAILFLVENISPEQVNFFKKILKESFSKYVKAADEVNVAFFNKNRSGAKSFEMLPLPGYIGDTLSLQNELDLYKTTTSNLPSSDLYLAIYDGIKELQENKSLKSKYKILVVLSCGKNNSNSPEKTTENAQNFSLLYKIPVYSIIYKSNNYSILRPLVEATYGRESLFTSKDTKFAIDTLTTFMNNAIERIYGKNYTLTFTTEQSKDGKTNTIKLKHNQNEFELEYTSPYLSYIKEYPIPIFGGGLIVIALIAYFVLASKKAKKLQEEKANSAQKQMQAAIEQNKQESVAKEAAIKQENERIANELKSRLAQQERENADRQRQEEEKRRQEQMEKQKIQNSSLQTEMMKKGLLRLFYNLNGANGAFEMKKTSITIGRKQGDLILNAPSMSGNHAEIYFENGEYFLKDLHSTNGTFINGRQISYPVPLKSGDSISMGEMKFTVHI